MSIMFNIWASVLVIAGLGLIGVLIYVVIKAGAEYDSILKQYFEDLDKDF